MTVGPGALLVVHASHDPGQGAQALWREPATARVLFLGQDYRQLRAWREAVEPVAEWVAAGPLLADAAAELRQPFLDLITELGRRYDSVAWWASRVSERNTLLSPLFLHCCYLRGAAAELNAGTTCVVSDSWEVLGSLAEIAHGRGARVGWIGRQRSARRATIGRLRVAWRVARFVGQGVARSGLAPPRIDPGELHRPLVLLSTWPEDTSYGEGGAFNDRYFPGLDEWLVAMGASTVTVPARSPASGSFRSMWMRLRQVRRRFLAPEAYYRASDYLFALREGRRGAAMPHADGLRLGGVDVGRLFDAERRRTAFAAATLEAALAYRLPRRLAEAGVKPDLAILPFENMIPEKPLLLGARRFLPATKLVGFQHGALYPLLLCNYVTRGESEFAPLPDRVVCNGELFRDVLVREGLPADRAVVGPALRYAHLWEVSGRSSARAAGAGCLLIPLPFSLDLGVELLAKAIHAFAGEPGLDVCLKPHPMGRVEDLLDAVGVDRLPAGFRLVGGSMERALAEANVVVALASSSVYEAVAAARPVVVVGRDAALDLNPLGFHPDLSRVFVDPAEIRAETRRLLDLSEDELDTYRRRARRLLAESFGPVTEETLRAFVDGFVTLPRATDADGDRVGPV